MRLKPEAWQFLKPILDQAADLPVKARGGFLEANLAAQPSLFRCALRLFENADTMPNLGENIRLRWRPECGAEDDRSGTVIGPYTILQKLGEGGMGVVYLAERELAGVRQKVALKVLKRGLDTEVILHRFHHERQILARLDHPHIVTLLDGGTTSDHLPYLVMTLVQGKTLYEYCRTEKPDLKTRLALFQKICLAVHFAHQNLVVHRDLKPGNLLITDSGEPRLLDFGIAKWLSQDQETYGFTGLGHRALTPDYASPEQIRGESVTTASDMYTLGILFFELVAGVQPFQDPATGRKALWDAQKFDVWEKPSTKLSQAMAHGFRYNSTLGDAYLDLPRPLVKRRVKYLRGDLDKIARKGMQVDVNERYGSAKQFADDVARFLFGRPVQARDVSLGYVLSKWVTRHKLAAGLGLSMLVLVTTFGVFTRIQSQRLTAQKSIAANARQKSVEVSRFLTETFAAAEPFEGDLCEATAEMLVFQAAGRLADDKHLSARIKAELIETVAGMYRQPRLLQDPEGLFFGALQDRLKKEAPNGVVAAGLHHVLGHYLLKKGSLQQAGFHFEAAKSGYGAGPGASRERADLESALGEISRKKGLHQDARLHQAQALAYLGSTQPDPGAAAKILKRLAAAQRRTGAVTMAAASLEKALRVLGEGEHHAVARAEIQTDLGLIYRELGRLDEAASLFKQGIEFRSHTFGPRSLWTAYQHNQLGWTYLAKGWFSHSEKAFEATYQIRKEQLNPGHEEVLEAQKTLAGIYILNGKFSSAVRLLSPMLESAVSGSQNCELSRSELFLFGAQAQIGCQNWTEAERLLEKAWPVIQYHGDAAKALLGEYYRHMGKLALDRGQFSLAQRHMNISADIFESALGGDSLQLARVWLLMSSYHLQKDQFELAQHFAEKALANFAISADANAPFIGEGFKSLGDIAMARGEKYEAGECYRNALEFMTMGYGLDSPRTQALQLALR